MGESPSDFLLAVEAINKRRTALNTGMRNFERHGLIRPKIRTAENSHDIVARNDSVEAVMIELVADIHIRACRPRQISRISFCSRVEIIILLFGTASMA